LQTFPDQWIFGGSWTECMRQLGNAVPVSLAECVGSELIRTLRKGAKRPIISDVVSPNFD
jgi:DNA (cytosine-5)-methyltransferase 1